MSEQRIALVTGGGTGIGKAISERLFKDGFTVVAAGLDDNELTEFTSSRESINQLIWKKADISDDNERQALFKFIEGQGALSVLVNNAAISGLIAGAPAMDMSPDFFRDILDVNLVAAFSCAQMAANLMKEHGAGAIINISSVASTAAQNNATAYCASKAGLDAVTRSLAFEWASYGIRVAGIAPGDIKTKNSDQVKAENKSNEFTRAVPLGRAGLPDEIANTVSFLASEQASYVTGETIRVDGGFLTY